MAAWAAEHRLDAILSTDGDGDRPLLTDAAGQVIPGDVLGQITAAVLRAEVVVTPVSSNTGVEASGRFARVIRTKIGSPFVIAGMQAAGPVPVVGYEANGGFLLGVHGRGPRRSAAAAGHPRQPLADDCALVTGPRGRGAGGTGGRRSRPLPPPTGWEEIPTEHSRALMARFDADPARLAGFLAGLGEVLAATDRTDGLRLTLASGRVVHMRPSGNAPEFRLYAEAESPGIAATLLEQGLTALRGLLLQV